MKEKINSLSTWSYAARSFCILAVLSLLFVTTGCDDDDDDDEVVEENEEELITTVKLTLTATGQDTKTITWKDLDGDGGDAREVDPDTLKLIRDVEYTLTIELKNEAESPAEDISEEVKEEDEEHQLFLIANPNTLFTYTYSDMDEDGRPIGLLGKLKTVDAERLGEDAGTLRVVLRHEPNKEAQGVSDGNIANAGGETDIDVSFDVEVKSPPSTS